MTHSPFARFYADITNAWAREHILEIMQEVAAGEKYSRVLVLNRERGENNSVMLTGAISAAQKIYYFEYKATRDMIGDELIEWYNLPMDGPK